MEPKATRFTLDFSNMRGGVNTKDPHISIGENQAYSGTYNVIFKKSGFSPWFAFEGIKDSPVLSGTSRGLDIYPRVTGDDYLIGYQGGKVYRIDKANGDLTELYNLGGDGECWGVAMYDKLFVANGSGSCVIEGSTGYPIGITPPSGVSAAPASGGSLPDGVYTVYVSYARRVSGVDVLYSVGQSLGNVTLGSGNNSIAFSNFANSADARVGNKVVWMTDAGGSDVIFFHETGDNTTTSFTLSSTTLRDSTKYYRILAASSIQPPAMTGIFDFDDRIFGWNQNVLYASMKAVTVYDLERWPEIQYEFPFEISSVFAIGSDLYLNFVNRGIARLPNADMAAAYKMVSRRMYFRYPRTVCNTDENSDEEPSPVIGVTNDGVRIFDGKRFTSDLSSQIKNDITDLYDGATSDFAPCGIVCRTKDRTEYRFSYRDLDFGTNCNNSCYILNMDELSIVNRIEYTAPWEHIRLGFNFAVIDYTGKLFLAQSTENGSQILIENQKSTIDRNYYDAGGNFVSAAAHKAGSLVTRMALPSIAGRLWVEQLRYISYFRSDATVTITIGEAQDLNDAHAVEKTLVSRFGIARFGVDRFSSNSPVIVVEPLAEDLKGVTVYVRIDFTSISYKDYISEMKLFGRYEEGRMQ